MAFVSGLPRTVNGCDTIWDIFDRLTKLAHFLLMRLNYPLEKLAEMYINKTVSLHGIPFNIVSDINYRFTYMFWESLHKALDTKLQLSFAYHP